MSDPLEPDRCSKYLRAVADPDRLRIVQCLRSGPKTVGELAAALDVPLANASHHLKLLRAVEIVRFAKKGRHVTYTLDPQFAREGRPRSLDVLDFGCCRIELAGDPDAAAVPTAPAASEGSRPKL